uniref:Uncharacterized protein n=1 Tax=Cucumis melo TaxID=3656 RepID=A0A9I9D9E6_CUCME
MARIVAEVISKQDIVIVDQEPYPTTKIRVSSLESIVTKIDGIEANEISKLEEGNVVSNVVRLYPSNPVVAIQKVIVELIRTYFVIFNRCRAVAVNKIYGSVTFLGICVVWGLIVMVMVYLVGHVSRVHFNPAVTLTFT